MKASLTESQAWSVVRATPPGRNPVRVAHPGHPDATVEVTGDGSWSSDAFVTDGARRVLDLYLPLRRRRAWVLGQMGQSLDGRIATESGHSHYVTGPDDIRRLHRLRALADAVVVGAGTASSDDPRLTVREVEGPDPVRVVLDPHGRLDPALGIFTDGASPTLVVRGTDEKADAGRGELPDPKDAGPGSAGAAAGEAPGGAGFEEILLPLDPSRGIRPERILSALRARGLRRVLVEGGGITVSRFLEAGLLDRLHVTVAPLILGSGRPAFTLEPVQTLREALRPACRTFPLGADVLFELDLRAGADEEDQEDNGAGDAGEEHQEPVGHGDGHAFGAG